MFYILRIIDHGEQCRRTCFRESPLDLYPVFILMATLTILSPGPGVLKSLTNALHYGIRPALAGIAGLACGVFCVAALTASSLGILLARSPQAFMAIRFAGAAYLVYLGIRLWRAPSPDPGQAVAMDKRDRTLFLEGWMLQFSNPNAVFFFLSVLPQFIRRQDAYLPQFLTLVLIFCMLLVLVHAGYAVFARHALRWLGSRRGGRWLNRAGGATFVLFGVLLLRAA